MSEDDPDNQLVPAGHGPLALTSLADNRILSEMVLSSLVLAKKAPALRIVVLEDEEWARILYNAVIRDWFKQATLIEFENGDDAWHELSRTEPNLFITDIIHPGLNSIDMFPRLAGRRIDYPILVVSGTTDNLRWEALKRIQLQHANLNIRILPKPFTRDDLRKAIEGCLSGKKEIRVTPVDLDALVEEGKKLYHDKGGMTEGNIRAFSLFYRAAVVGHIEAQYLVSECYRLGCGVQQDESEALPWLRESAVSGFVKACVRLGLFYQRKNSKNDEEAIKWYQKAAETGSAVTCLMLAQIYKDRGDLTGELAWEKQYALQGNPEALWGVRTFYECKDGVEMDFPEAYAWLSLFEDSYTTWKNSEELVCFQLDPESSKYKTTSQELKPLMSAAQLDQGNRRYQDLVKQRAGWIRKKAEQGSKDEQYNMGWCYRNGYGAPQDPAEAVRWWRMAAEQGHANAQASLGFHYRDGKGVLQDDGQAVSWFRKAAEQGIATAQNELGVCYSEGHGVPQNYLESVKWWRKASEQGHKMAQENLGACYANGRAAIDIEDAIDAYEYVKLAEEKACEGATTTLAVISAFLSPEELREAERRYSLMKAKRAAKP